MTTLETRSEGSVKIFSSKRRVAIVAVAFVLLLFFWRPGASRLKSRIILSISAAVGRPVDIGSVHVQILPRPGFDLNNLVVYDDPAFGAEPMLRASEVTASLRLASLLRGRIEIAQLDLTEPSLNLVHDGGRWNLEALLERTAHIPLAPTGKAKYEPRPGFPYIVATSGRINFKSGPEKKPYALTSADFSLWQDSENTWGVRLKAQPVRTDLNLSDTGLLQVSGTWQRAQTFRDTPMQFGIEWSRAQLGQLTKFLTGNDKGWRGAIDIDVAVSGTPAKLRTSASASIEDFRRYDITSGNALRLAASCDAEYSSLTHEFHEVLCSAPVAQGLVTVSGDVGLPGSHRFAVLVKAENVPANGLVAVVQHAKKNLPDDLTAEGTLSGSLSMQEDAAREIQFHPEGRGGIDNFRLVSVSNKTEFGPVTLPFLLDANQQIDFGPVAMGNGHAAPTLRGSINRTAYRVNMIGEADIARTLRLARTIGIPVLATTAEGTAQVDLQIAGLWAGQTLANSANAAGSGFAGPLVTGTARLRNVQVTPRGVSGPLEISSAEFRLLPDKVYVAKINAKAAGTSWTGSLEMPRGCGIACPVRFMLNANQIALNQLAEWAGPGTKKRPWYRVLNTDAVVGPGVLVSIHAAGHVTADRLIIRNLTATQVSANVALNNGNLKISALDADFSGGKYHGEWQADFSAKLPVCKGSGRFSDVSLAELAEVMNDDWMAGQADGSYEISGKCPAGFWQSAQGTIRLEGSEVSLPHVSIEGNNEGLSDSRFSAQADLHDATIEIKSGNLEAPNASYAVHGTATLARELDIQLTRIGGASYTVSGTLADPVVAPMTRAEQARLKP
jgi:AsmA family/AsmA-like C-terminal region